MTVIISVRPDLIEKIRDMKDAVRKRGQYRYTSPTGAVVKPDGKTPPCPHSPAMLRVLIAEALKQPRYIRRKTSSYLLVDGRLIPDGKGDFVRVPEPKKPTIKRSKPDEKHIWADGREAEFPRRYTDGGRFVTPHRKEPACNDNVPATSQWRVARPVGKLREHLPIVTALRKEGGLLYRPDINTPREALVYVAQALADDFELAAMPIGYVPTNHCRRTDERLDEDYNLLRADNGNGEFIGKAAKARSETYSWLPVIPKNAFSEERFSIVAGTFTATEPVIIETAINVDEETTRHVNYNADGKAEAEMRDWVVTISDVYRVNIDGISIWRHRERKPALDADGNPKHDGKPKNEMRFIRKESSPADRSSHPELDGADIRVESVQRLEIIRRVLSKNQFQMLRMACLHGATMIEIAEAFGFGNDKQATPEVRGILREALTRAAEIYAKMAAIERGDAAMTVRDWMDLGCIDKVLTASNDNVYGAETDRGYLVAA